MKKPKLTPKEQYCKDRIKSILGMTEEQFMNTPAKEIKDMLFKKANEIKSN